MGRRILIIIWALVLTPALVFSQGKPLSLADLQMTTLYKSVDEALQDPTNVYRLNIANQKLTELPSDIGQMVNLQYLNVGKNTLTSLPAEIGKLKNLQWLIVEDNNLASLPSELSQLPNLEVLDVDGNINLTPASIFDIASSIPSLKELSMKNILINSFPQSFFKMNNIEKLYMVNCGINVFPDNMGELYKLKVLDVSFNNIGRLPGDIENMKRLQELYLGGNGINELPIEIQELRFTLQKLSFASRNESTGNMVGNPITEEMVKRIQDWLPRTLIENIYK